MAWPFRRRAKAIPPDPRPKLVDAPRPPPMRWPLGLAQRLRAVLSRRQTRAEPRTFVLPAFPPGVGEGAKGAGLAMDSDPGLVACAAWANGLMGYLGATFIGYPALAEMATRPEYRMICETYATEMTRKWVRFRARSEGDTTKAAKIAELEAAFERLQVRDVFQRALAQDGYFGRGHIYVDTGDADVADELRTPIGDGRDGATKAKIRKGSLKGLRTVEAVWCYPTNYNSNDPLKTDWYRPETWYVQSKVVHRTRLITIVAREVPDLLKPTYSFGGLSLSQLARPYVENWLQTRQSVNDIINAFSVFVLATDMGTQLQGDGQQLIDRAEAFNVMRDNRGVMMIDKDREEFQNVAAPLGGLHELQSQSQEHMCAVAHAPTVKLLGIQPQGFNADSEGVLRAYYDWIASQQQAVMMPPLWQVKGLAETSLWGAPDDDIIMEPVPLWAMTEKEEAEVNKTKAETDQINVDLGAIHPEEVRERIAYSADSEYSGIDVDDVPDLEEEEEKGLMPKGGAAPPGGGGESDSNDREAA